MTVGVLFIRSVATIGCAATVLAQQPAPPAGTAVVRGRVTGADTVRPLRRAQVVLIASGAGGARRTVNTDNEGRYEVKDLVAGQYTVSVNRSGYLSMQYGQQRPLESARPLQVNEGQAVDRIDFTLPRAGAITGRVTDEAGDPIAGVLVFAMRPFYFEGRRQLMPLIAAPQASDDAGRYRLYGLVPGTYVVMARSRETWTVHTKGITEVMGFQPTYFPGTSSASQAKCVTVAVGQTVADADFALVPGHAASISGIAVDSAGRPLQSVGLGQEFRSPIGLGAANFGGLTTTVGPDGRFTFRNIPAGEWVVRASNRAADRPETAAVPIVVDGVDLDNISVVTSAGWSVTGQFVTDNGTPPPFPRERIAIMGRPRAAPTPVAGRGEVSGDWTFTIRDVVGQARLQVDPPDGWTVKAIWHDGREITDTPIDLKSGEVLSGVQVVLTDRVTTVRPAVGRQRRAVERHGDRLRR